MKQIYTLIIVVLLFCAPANAQKRVVDAETHSPIAAASIFDAVGNMVGFTWSDGVFSEVPETAYPITLRCMGYEPLVIERPEEKTSAIGGACECRGQIKLQILIYKGEGTTFRRVVPLSFFIAIVICLLID